jgi:hypothetical protein
MDNITVFRLPLPVSFEDDDEDTLPKYYYTFDARNLSESEIIEHFVNPHTNNSKFPNPVWYGYRIYAESQTIQICGMSETDFNKTFGHFDPRVICLDHTNPLAKMTKRMRTIPETNAR